MIDSHALPPLSTVCVSINQPSYCDCVESEPGKTNKYGGFKLANMKENLINLVPHRPETVS